MGCPKEAGQPQVSPKLGSLGKIRVRVNPDLITDTAVPPLARVLYCVLLGLERLKKGDTLSSYAAIAQVVHLQPRTVKQAIGALVGTGWLAISQPNQRAPLRFGFPNPTVARQRALIRRARLRLLKSKYRGEALALLWCDTLVASTNCMDDHFPVRFINPVTHELLAADRYYFDPDVAIEFNGPQHEGPTTQFSAEVAAAQIARDRIKREICDREKIPLITLRPEDLTFQRMREIIGRVLPLHDLKGDEPIIT